MKDFLKLGISGPSGSGKTTLALSIAKEFDDVCLVDSENKADYYLEKYKFDTLSVTPPFTIKKLLDYVYSSKHNIIIIDSLSQFWAGEGGILDTQTNYFLSNGNVQQSWSKVMPDIYAVIKMINTIPKHIIATFRTKQDYIIAKDPNDNERILKVGLSPMFKDGIEYEFPIFLELNMNSTINIAKDYTKTFSNGDTVTEEAIKKIRDFYKKDPTPTPTIQDILNEAANFSGDKVKLRALYKKYASIINALPENEKATVIQEFARL